jgi:iron complex outermembrane recepter protein
MPSSGSTPLVALAAGLVMLLLLAVPAVGQQPGAGSIVGRVTAEDGRPLDGAAVRVQGTALRVLSDGRGVFRVVSVPPGRYTLVVEALGFRAATAEVTVVAGGRAEAEIALGLAPLALDGLVVTSQRRAQQIQDVPIPVTALQGDFLVRNDIQQFDVLSDYVPGLNVQIQSPNNPGFVIRGITSDDGDSRVEPRVSVFQDGVSISKSRGSVVELFDMERVEVLKGPQGTLFGRGAQIGAVHLIQNKAQDRTSAELRGGPGNFNEWLLAGHANAPLVRQRLFARAAGIYNARDGYVENLSGGDLNGKETLAFRTSLRWVPDALTGFDLILNWQRDTPPGTAFKSGTFAPAGGTTSPFTPADLGPGEDLFIDRTVWGATLLGDRALGRGWTLNSVTAYREFDSVESFDADGTPAPALLFREEARGEQLSQEFRLTFQAGGPLSGFVGTSYFREKGTQRVPWVTDERALWPLMTGVFNAQSGGAFPITPMMINGRPNLVDRLPQTIVALNPALAPLVGAPLKPRHEQAYANFGETTALEFFADGTLRLLPRFSLTTGLRASREAAEGGYESETAPVPSVLGVILGSGPNVLFPPTPGRLSRSETFTSWVGRVLGQVELATNTSLFGGVSRGRRPQVIFVNHNTSEVIDEEIVWSYDAGIRGVIGGGRVQYDANVFVYDYRNFRTDVRELDEQNRLVIRPRNTGSASAAGFESSVRAAVTQPLSVFASYAWIDASIDEFDRDGRPQDLGGNRFRLTPEHQLALGLDLRAPVGPRTQLFLTPSYAWRSHVFFEEENQPGVEQDGYGLLNLRGGFSLMNGRYEIVGYMRNALDQEYLLDGGNTGGAFGIPTFIPGPPRFFGVQLTTRF